MSKCGEIEITIFAVFREDITY